MVFLKRKPKKDESFCVRYVPPNDEHHARLRGLKFFLGMQRYYDVQRKRGAHARVHIGTQGSDFICRDEVLFMVMPCTDNTAQSIHQRVTSGQGVIVDVTADVLSERPRSEAMLAAGSTLSREAHEYWARPDVLEAYLRCLADATVVTTSWKELVDPLRELTTGKVFYLPNFREGKLPDVKFASIMSDVLHEALHIHH